MHNKNRFFGAQQACRRPNANPRVRTENKFKSKDEENAVKVFQLTTLAALLAAALSGCGSSSDSTAPTMLTGVAASGAPLANADIVVCGANGVKKTASTDSQGAYSVDISGLTAPLMVGVTSAPLSPVNGIMQPINGTKLYTAILPSLGSGSNIANVNPLTDKIASDVATTDMNLKGSVQLYNACASGVVAKASVATIKASTDTVRSLVSDALTAAKVSNVSSFDPVTTAMKADHTGVDAVLDMIYHNRDGFGSATDNQLTATHLYDRNMQELSTANVTLDATLPAWSSYKTRIFVIGDSTASNYGKDVAPRMGWGQTFDRFVADTTATKVVNLAQSGRSSRSFITEGWFAMLANNLQKGDYVLVQFGHNDEKCSTTASLDWANRCTYPNSATSAVQSANATSATAADGTVYSVPPGVATTDLSFQRSLEKYVALAKSKGATIVLLTPVTRINQDKTVTTYNEGKFPITKSTHITSSGDYFGNYSQTVTDTGKANSAPVVDLDAKSIAFMNSIGVGTGGVNATGGWRDYHNSSSDFTKYPYYATKFDTDGVTPLAYTLQTTGNYMNADRTHFKESGAVKVDEMIIEGIKADTSGALTGLVSLLK